MSFTPRWQCWVKGKQGVFDKAVPDLHTWESVATVKYLCILQTNLSCCYFTFRMCKVSDEGDNQTQYSFLLDTELLGCFVFWQVLEAHPNYPKIRKEILDKARASLRTWYFFFLYGSRTLIWLQKLWMKYCSDRDHISTKALLIWLTIILEIWVIFKKSLKLWKKLYLFLFMRGYCLHVCDVKCHPAS